jgi:16S rRNA (cytosine1402-N4)-methyltransferase
MDSNIKSDVAGGPVRHVPVMLNEVLSCLQLTATSSSDTLNIVDGTFGAGGYSTAMVEAGARVMGIDRDPNAIRDGEAVVAKLDGKLVLVAGEFRHLDTLAAENDFGDVNGVVLDIGVSSMQLDEAERGFSFQKDGPLDMRMSQSGVSAADVVNTMKQGDLTRVIGILGEERKASHVSRAIVRERDKQPFSTTLQLANLVEKTLGRRATDRIHPATKTFQALRIFVNQELEQLGEALFAAERLLVAGGRLVVVTFHSLEDRLVKLFFKDRSGRQEASRHLPLVNHKDATFVIHGKGLLKASREEAEINPRSRSAKLRWAERNDIPAGKVDMSIFGLPNLVSLDALQAKGE